LNFAVVFENGNLLIFKDRQKRRTLESGQIVDRVLTTRNARPSRRAQQVIHEGMNLPHSLSVLRLSGWVSHVNASELLPVCQPSETNIASSRGGRDKLAYGIVTDCTSITLASL
jgi:hypothetical protein